MAQSKGFATIDSSLLGIQRLGDEFRRSVEERLERSRFEAEAEAWERSRDRSSCHVA
jgi:hypothetical protein